MRYLLVLLPLVLFTGCLKTRNEVNDGDSRRVMQQQTVAMQKANAESRVAELEEELRVLNGRLDVVENNAGKKESSAENAAKTSQQQQAEANQRMILLQEALTKQEQQLAQLNAELQGLRAEKSAAVAEKAAKDAKKDSYEAAQEFFDKKNWKQAILNYQKSRDDHPKGKTFADATYKIGVSFQELGMKDEAKTFYDEVVAKFPKSEEARRAKIRLKNLSKK